MTRSLATLMVFFCFSLASTVPEERFQRFFEYVQYVTAAVEARENNDIHTALKQLNDFYLNILNSFEKELDYLINNFDELLETGLKLNYENQKILSLIQKKFSAVKDLLDEFKNTFPSLKNFIKENYLTKVQILKKNVLLMKNEMVNFNNDKAINIIDMENNLVLLVYSSIDIIKEILLLPQQVYSEHTIITYVEKESLNNIMKTLNKTLLSKLYLDSNLKLNLKGSFSNYFKKTFVNLDSNRNENSLREFIEETRNPHSWEISRVKYTITSFHIKQFFSIDRLVATLSFSLTDYVFHKLSYYGFSETSVFELEALSLVKNSLPIAMIDELALVFDEIDKNVCRGWFTPKTYINNLSKYRPKTLWKDIDEEFSKYIINPKNYTQELEYRRGRNKYKAYVVIGIACALQNFITATGGNN